MRNGLVKSVLIGTTSLLLSSCIPAITPKANLSAQSEQTSSQEKVFTFEIEGREYFALDLDGDRSIDVVLEKREGSIARLSNGRVFYDSKAHRAAEGYEFQGEEIKQLRGFELRAINEAYKKYLDNGSSR